MFMDKWTLNQQFIVAEIERLNNPDYFAIDFDCPDLDALVRDISTARQAQENRDKLNNFFDHLISSNDLRKSIYVRLKWLVYLDKIVYIFEEGSVMYGLTLKALQVYTDKIYSFIEQTTPFEKYLARKLFKPYIQYLSKLCLLNVSNKSEEEGTDKQNKPLRNLSSPSKKSKSKKDNAKADGNSVQVLKWYREYNFVFQTLQTFSPILKEQEPFFRSELPFLTNIKRFMSKNLKQILRKLKMTLLSLDDLNMTMMELEALETKIIQFSKLQQNIFEGSESILMTGIEDYTKEDISNFMCTPLKAQNNNSTLA